jgi:hypothetical protein
MPGSNYLVIEPTNGSGWRAVVEAVVTPTAAMRAHLS